MISNKLLFVSAVLLSISVSLSMALDHFAIAVGLIGLIWFIVKGEFYLRRLDLRLFFVSLSGFTSSLFSGMFIYSLKNSHYIWHFLPYFIVSRIGKKHIKMLLNIFAIFLIISSCGVFFQGFFHIRPNDIFKHISELHFYHSIMLHSSGFFNNPLTTAGVMAPSALLFLSLTVFSRENAKIKTLYLSASILSLAAVLILSERSYWLGFLSAILLLPLIYRKKISLIITLLVVILSVLSYFSIQPIHKRVNSIVYFHKDESAMDRIAMWRAALDKFKNENITRKLIGCGSGNVSGTMKPYLIKSIKKTFGDKNIKSHMFSALHNEYLQILIKWGIIGLIIWLYMWFYVIKGNIKFINKSDDNFSISVSIGLTLAFIAFLVGGFFEHNVGDAEVIIFIMYLLGIKGSLEG